MSTHLGKSLLRVGVVILLCYITLLAVQYVVTPVIDKKKRVLESRMADAVIPVTYDNNLAANMITVRDAKLRADGGSTKIFTAKYHYEPVAFVFMPIVLLGYNGRISLLVSIDKQGRLLAVRVLDEQESHGLGDQIRPDRGDWLQQFFGRGLQNEEQDSITWQVRQDGGEFDGISGATITSRSVITALKNTLDFYRTKKYSLPGN